LELKLNFDIPSSPTKINSKDPICLIGSCFSDDIGSIMKASKLKAFSNPFGTIYNPHSIFKLLSGNGASDNVIESQGIHFHWDAHSKISGIAAAQTIELFEKSQNQTQQYLKQAKWLIITLGTAWVYRYTKTQEIVANNHKVPNSDFTKELLSINTIVSDFQRLDEYLREINPDLNIIFTVSPVRHIKDGLIDNNRSKAILLESIHRIVEEYPSIQYFPSYEIAIDELRDYRFYNSDLIHPSSQAVKYIWNRFMEVYFSSESKAILDEWEKLKSSLDHKPFNPQSLAHQKFLNKTISKLEKLNEKVDLSVEIQALKDQLV